MQSLTYSLSSIDEVVELLYEKMQTHRVFTFTGPLGAGKTALIKLLLARCGVSDVVTSPTFTYMAVYSNDKKDTFYHFDLYRMCSLDDFMHAGFDEYLYVPGSWAFIEWPEIVMPLLTNSVCHINLDYLDLETRSLNMVCK